MAQTSNQLCSYARKSVQAGAALWLVSLLVRIGESPETELIERVLLFGLAVVVPLGLLVINGRDRNDEYPYLLALFAQPICAILVFVSFLLPTGPLAALTALSLLVLDILLAAFGLFRFTKRTTRRLEELSIDVALFYPLIGGVSLVFYQLDIQPFGFGATIILLTAVHFHFAGFATPIIAGMTGRFLRARGGVGLGLKLAIVLVAVSMPIVAFGITLSPPIALLGTIFISIGMLMLSGFSLVSVLPQIAPIRIRVLLSISALSPIVAMLLASLYAYSIVTKQLIINIPTMAVSHGLLNAFGFSFCGLLAWYFILSTRSDSTLVR